MCNLWAHVIRHFEGLLAELEPTDAQRDDAFGKATRVAKSLAAAYYPNTPFDNNVALVGGSVGKGTAIRPPSDVDLIFILPRSEFYRIDALAGNKQSQLLQEIKRALIDTYPNTDIRGDGPVVKVPFASLYFEVLPTFICDDGSHLTAHTKNGGTWRYYNPHLEANWLQEVNGRTSGKATHLIKMLKAWKCECNVDVKSICLEVAAGLFVDQWLYRDKTLFYYDWMIRDFYRYMLDTLSSGGWVSPAGNPNHIYLGDAWQTKAQSAYDRSLKACQYEQADDAYNASAEWRKIFGAKMPLDISKSLAALYAGLLS